MDVHPQSSPLDELVDYVDATFRPMAADKGLAFDGRRGRSLPASCYTDEQRLQQVLRNLLSNAVKFTASGEVALHRSSAPDGVEFRRPDPAEDAGRHRASRSIDTGIGIPPRQAAGRSSRRSSRPTARPAASYGGTGLGLSISREIAHLLGGEIHVAQRAGEGSTFTAATCRSATPVPADDARLAAPSAATRTG